nr:winged helix-turn-helix domain-containing protein [Micromonospora echinaurantiaca]
MSQRRLLGASRCDRIGLPREECHARSAGLLAHRRRCDRRRQSQEIEAGDRLPSIAELRDRYGVSHGTVQMSYARLEALRVIRRQQGKGVFVTDPKTWMREP